MENIKVLLADDQLLFIESLKRVLETEARDIKVVGLAQNGMEAVALARSEEPDIVLMDIRMPQMDGVQATRAIHQKYPAIQIIMLTTFDDDDYVRDALYHGAVGYLLKENIRPDDLAAAVRLIKKGSYMMSPTIAQRIIEKSCLFDSDQSGSSTAVTELLNEREKQILRLMARGFDNVEIADQACLAVQTVKNYVSSIYSKLDVHHRAQAQKIGIEMIRSQARPSEKE